MNNSIFYYFLFLFLIIYIFLNLGNFLDVTERAKRADLIVSLGGGPGLRLSMATELYKKGFSKSNIIIYTGSDKVKKSFESTMSKREYLLKNGILAENVVHVNGSIISNTMEEIMFVKKYMLAHNYKNVIFVSHQFHSRRISILAKFVAKYELSGLNFIVVSCNPKWWNSKYYYTSISNIELSIKEIIKIVYNVVKYKFFPSEKYKKLERLIL